MTHRHRDGTPKIVTAGDLPLTALGAVDTVITELAILDFVDVELTLVEIMPGPSLEENRASTSAESATDPG